MQPLKSDQIKGNWVTVLLPINADESIDFNCLNDEIDVLVSVKPDGMYCNGTAGEFYNITEAEYDTIARMLADKCNQAEIPFQIGVSHMSPVISLERLKQTVDLKPSAVQVILPDWFRPTDAEAIDYMNVMAETASDIGLVLYNPPHAKRVFSPGELLHLQEKVRGMVGVKVADGDDQWYDEMKPLAQRISVFLPGHRIATGYKKGVCQGSYSNMACLNPKAAQLWSDQIHEDLDGALELEVRINRFLDQHIVPFITQQKFSNQAVDKMLAQIGGWSNIGLKLRWPYKSVPEYQAKRLRPIAEKLIPEFFVSL